MLPLVLDPFARHTDMLWRWFSVVAALAASTAVAQTPRLEVEPIVGYYRPLGHFVDKYIFATNLPDAPQDLSGVAYGLELRSWFRSRWGASLGAVVRPGEIPETSTPGGPRGPYAFLVQMVNAQALYNVAGSPNVHHTWVSAGVGLVRHGGVAYAPYETRTEIAGAFGVARERRVSSHLGLTVGANLSVYEHDIPLPPVAAKNPGRLEHGLQEDLLLHIGISYVRR
jgi:hypothetical protein